MVGDEPVYGRLKIDDAVEDAPLETTWSCPPTWCSSRTAARRPRSALPIAP
jgi:hypothetical protein